MKKKYYLILLLAFLLLVSIGCNSSKNTSGQATSLKAFDKNTVTLENSTAKVDNKVQKTNENNSTNRKNPSTPINVESIILKAGANNGDVLLLQKKLYNIGFDLSVDGIYGNETVKAITNIQKKNNLKQTGNYNVEVKAIIDKMPAIRDYDKIKAAASTPKQPTNINANANIPNIKTNPGASQQVIVVSAASYGTYKANYIAYEKTNGSWHVFSSGSAVVGINGFSDNRKEGDLTTPTGKYGFPFMFGNAPNPGVKFEYRKVTVGDYWVSNKILSEYNVWMHYTGPNPKARLYDYEELWTQPLYKYAAVIDFNYYSNKQLGKGSGIFLHIAPYSGYGTAGCVGVAETNLVKILKWLDPAKKPCIIMGVKGRI